ncbi:MAG TPA: T9SS type A sorting domain-containing protein, partial [bacterium]|nr:T9SS type A sorting domain-containing protein [bacterium]
MKNVYDIFGSLPDTIDDEFGSKYRLQNSLQSGFAYWYKYTNAAQETYTINPTGSAIGGSPITIQLKAGWNQIGNPFYYYISWDSCLINGLTPAQAEQYGFIQNAIHWYNRTDDGAYGYVRTPDVAANIDGYLKPYFGGWIFAYQNCELTLNATPVIPTSQFLDIAPNRFAPRRATSKDWQLKFSVSSAHSFDDQNYIGVSSEASNNNDSFDKFKAPSIEGYAEISFIGAPAACNTAGQTRYATDYRKPFDTYQQWDFVLNSDLKNTKLTISWDYAELLPENFVAYLEDIQTGAVIDITEKKEYTLITGNSRVSRNFRIKIGDKQYTQQMFSVGLTSDTMYVYPNPVKPSQGETLKFKAINNSNLNIKIFDISGEKVIEINAPVDAGQDYYTWNLRNSSGKNIASGVYLYIMEARDNSGNSVIKRGKFAVIR